MKTDKLPFKIRDKIKRSKQSVFVPGDFTDLSGYVQILRVLKNMVDNNELIKLGQGIYVKVRKSADGKIRPIGYVGDMVKVALRKYGIKTLPSTAVIEYNSGISTQVPTGRVIGVDKRVRRQIGYNGVMFQFETMGKNKVL